MVTNGYAHGISFGCWVMGKLSDRLSLVPPDSVTRRTVIVGKGNGRRLWPGGDFRLAGIFRSRRFGNGGLAPATEHCLHQPLYDVHGDSFSELSLAEGVGNAPTSGSTDPVFGTGAASLYLPAFRNWLPGLDLHQHRAV